MVVFSCVGEIYSQLKPASCVRPSTLTIYNIRVYRKLNTLFHSNKLVLTHFGDWPYCSRVASNTTLRCENTRQIIESPPGSRLSPPPPWDSLLPGFLFHLLRYRNSLAVVYY